MTSLTQMKLPKLRSAFPKIKAFDVVRVILGLILLTAAGLKCHQLATEPTLEKSFLTSRWFLIAEVEFELVLGIFLLSGFYRRLLWLVTLICFTAFSCIAFYKALSGQATCGCFGKLQVNPWYTLMLDLSAITALMIFPPLNERSHITGQFNWRKVLRAGSWFLILGTPMGIAMGIYRPVAIGEDGFFIGDGDCVILEPSQWLGKRFPLRKHIDVANEISKGKWIVVLYHYDCLRCREALWKYDRLAGQGKGIQVALIQIPPYDPAGDSLHSLKKRCLSGKLLDAKQWFVITPTELFLDNGEVIQVNVGVQERLNG